MSQHSIAIGAAALVAGIQAIAWSGRRWPRRTPATVREQVRYAGFHDGPTLVTAVGTIPTGFRYCPAEFRTVAAFLHADGSAACADPDCGAHIPATEEGAA